MNKPKETNALIVSTNSVIRDYYFPTIQSCKFLDHVEMATSLDEFKEKSSNQFYKYIFIGEMEGIEDCLTDCNCHILEHLPSTRLVLLGMEWAESKTGEMIHPIRGVIDRKLQTDKQIHASLDKIHKKRFDFELVIANQPHLKQIIQQASKKMPIQDDHFLNFLPLLGTASTMIDNARYLGLSDRVLRIKRNKWRSITGAENPRVLYTMALELGWTTTEASHAAANRMIKFLNEQGDFE